MPFFGNYRVEVAEPVAGLELTVIADFTRSLGFNALHNL
jgi:hypothetical protein